MSNLFCPACGGSGYGMRGEFCTWCRDKNKNRVSNISISKDIPPSRIAEAKRMFVSEFRRLLDGKDENGGWAWLMANNIVGKGLTGETDNDVGRRL